jgi:hypothetical protein
MSGTILQTCKINIVSPKYMDVVLRIDGDENKDENI